MNEKNTKIDTAIKSRLENYPEIMTRYYHSLIDSGKTYGTARTYMQSIIQFLDYKFGKNVPVYFFRFVSARDISSFLDSLKAKGKTPSAASGSAKAAVWSALMSLFAFISTQYYRVENPVEKVPRPAIEKKADSDLVYLTAKETRILLQAVEYYGSFRFVRRDKCLLMLGFYCGLRINDILALNIDDVDLGNGKLRIVDQKKGDRIIPMSEMVQKELRHWLIDREYAFDDIDTDALFVSQVKSRLSTNMVQKLLEKYSKGIGKRVTPRVLRNTFAVNLYVKTGDILLCAKYLDHVSIATTQKYIEQVVAHDKSVLDINDLYD